jgi:hypothetical protein
MDNYIENQEDIEKLFNEEVRDKKITGRGIHNRAPRKSGLRHAMMTRVDMLKGKAKKEYTKGSEVMSYNLYDNVIAFDEFEKLDEKKKKETLKRWSDKGFTTGDVKKLWGKSIWKYNQYRKKFGMTKVYEKFGVSSNNSVPVPVTNVVENLPVKQASPTVQNQYAIFVNQQEELPFTIKINKNFSGADVSKKLMNLASYFENEDGEYKVEIKISEVVGENK